MALERTYTIPLRKGWLKAARYRRAKKAVNTVKEFLVRHMKSDDVRLGTHLNLEIWKHGMKNPPSRVKVNVSKDDKGVVRAELFGAPKFEEKKAEEKKGIVKKIAEKVVGAKPAEVPKAESKPEVKPAEAPKVEAKPAETKPVEKKAEVKPAPAKPAEKKAVPKKPAAKKEAAA
jgi:large subunit ribosomal protein L31e